MRYRGFTCFPNAKFEKVVRIWPCKRWSTDLRHNPGESALLTCQQRKRKLSKEPYLIRLCGSALLENWFAAPRLPIAYAPCRSHICYIMSSPELCSAAFEVS